MQVPVSHAGVYKYGTIEELTKGFYMDSALEKSSIIDLFRRREETWKVFGHMPVFISY